MLSYLRPGGTLVLNTMHTDLAALEGFLPNTVSREFGWLVACPRHTNLQEFQEL